MESSIRHMLRSSLQFTGPAITVDKNSMSEQRRRASNWIQSKWNSVYDSIHVTLTGRTLNNEDQEEKMSVHSQASKSLRRMSNATRRQSLDGNLRDVVDRQFSFNVEDNEDIDNSRNLVVDATTMFRKGPIPIECLSHNEQVRLSRLGCLKEWDDSDTATSDNFVNFEESPSSKALLTYFARLGSGEDDNSVNLSHIISLLDSGASFNYPDVFGQSIFFAVVRDWHTDVARFALQHDVDINHADKYGRTPLHLAAAINYAEMVQLLIDYGADLTTVTFGENQNALHYAARYGSVACLQILIDNGAQIDSLDFMERTPMQLAAEIGNEDSVEFFLKLGAPVGVYDINGCSAMMMMIEKMPHMAYEGLNQFVAEYHAMRRRYFYLGSLEFGSKTSTRSYGRNVLQTIAQYKDINLVMHPAVLKLLSVKWKLFGFRYAIVSNLTNCVYTALATVITFSIPFHPYDQQFTPLHQKWWKVMLAALFVAFTVYFWIMQVLNTRRLGKRDAEYKEFRLEALRKQLPYCHPRWFEEKEYYDLEVERIQSYSSAFWDDKWNIFEWVSLVFVLLQIFLLVANDVHPSKHVFSAAKFISAFSLLLIWLRLYKSLRVITIFAELVVMLSFILIETCKFVVMFIDFFLPYTFFFFMVMGGEPGTTKTKEKSDHSLADIAFQVWKLAIKTKYLHIAAVDPHIGMVMVGVFFALIAFFLQSIYIGRMSEIFCRGHQEAVSAATLLRATVLVNAEHALSASKERMVRRFMREHCGPMIVTLRGSENLGNDHNVKVRIDNLMKEIDKLTMYIGKVSFLKEEGAAVSVERFSQVYKEVERAGGRQQLIEDEIQGMRERFKEVQKHNLGKIKNVIEQRSDRADKERQSIHVSKKNK